MENPFEIFMEKVPEVVMTLAEKEIEQEKRRAAGVALFSAIYLAFGTTFWKGGYRSLTDQNRKRIVRLLKFAKSKAQLDLKENNKDPDRMFISAMANVWASLAAPLSKGGLASQEMKKKVKEAMDHIDGAKREADRIEDFRGNPVYDFGKSIVLYYFAPESDGNPKQQAMRKLQELQKKGDRGEFVMVAQAFLADMYARQGNLREVIRICQTLRERAPKIYHIPRAMSHAYLSLGELDKAKEMILEAQRLQPNDPQVMLDVAKFLLLKGDIKKAEALVSKARKSRIADKFSSEILSTAVRIEVEKGNLRQVKKVLEKFHSR